MRMRRWMQRWNDEILERPYFPVGQQTAGRIIEMLRNAASSYKEPTASGWGDPRLRNEIWGICVDERGPFTRILRRNISKLKLTY